MADTNPDNVREVKSLSGYAIPIVISIIGIILICTAVGAWIGLPILAIGLIWGAAAVVIRRAQRRAISKGELPP